MHIYGMVIWLTQMCLGTLGTLGVVHAEDDVHYSVGSFVTRHNPTAKITSMISSLYISDEHDDDD